MLIVGGGGGRGVTLLSGEVFVGMNYEGMDTNVKNRTHYYETAEKL